MIIATNVVVLYRMAQEDIEKRSVVELTLLQMMIAMTKNMQTLVEIVEQQKEQLKVLQHQLQGQTNVAFQSGNGKKRQGQRNGQRNDSRKNKKGRWKKNKKQKKNNGCERCGRNYNVKDCPWANGTCFRYNQKGHLIANCPTEATQK